MKVWIGDTFRAKPYVSDFMSEREKLSYCSIARIDEYDGSNPVYESKSPELFYGKRTMGVAARCTTPQHNNPGSLCVANQTRKKNRGACAFRSGLLIYFELLSNVGRNNFDPRREIETPNKTTRLYTLFSKEFRIPMLLANCVFQYGQ